MLAKGITINGLPIMLKRPNASTLDIEELDIYYEDCVIGGPGAFVIPISERESSRRRSAPSWCWRSPAARRERRVDAGAAADKPRISCTIGERMWQERWGN